METKVLISGKVAKRISKQLGSQGLVDSEMVSEIDDMDNAIMFRIKVYHQAFADQVEKLLDTKLNWVKKD